MELEDLTLQVGKDFQRVNVKQELQCDSHIVLKSGNVLKTDTIQALAETGITFDAQKLTMFTKAITGFATSDLSTWTNDKLIDAATVKTALSGNNVDLSGYVTSEQW